MIAAVEGDTLRLIIEMQPMINPDDPRRHRPWSDDFTVGANQQHAVIKTGGTSRRRIHEQERLNNLVWVLRVDNEKKQGAIVHLHPTEVVDLFAQDDDALTNPLPPVTLFVALMVVKGCYPTRLYLLSRDVIRKAITVEIACQNAVGVILNRSKRRAVDKKCHRGRRYRVCASDTQGNARGHRHPEQYC